MISRKSEEVLNRAGRFAVENNHEYCTLEHVFWAMLEDPGVTDILDAVGADPKDLKRDLEEYIDREVPRNEAPGAADEEPPVVTVGVQDLLQRALFHVQSSGKDEVEPRDLFVALFQARDSQSLYLLQKLGIERLDVLNFISHGTLRDDRAPVPAPSKDEGEQEGERVSRARSRSSRPISISSRARGRSIL